jgi:DNA-binding CsgD family transcriptional regulator
MELTDLPKMVSDAKIIRPRKPKATPEPREKTGLLKRAMIDRGLDTLLCTRSQGQTFTFAQIAAACGCTGEGIRRIERKALRKLGAKLRAECGISMQDFIDMKSESL